MQIVAVRLSWAWLLLLAVLAILRASTSLGTPNLVLIAAVTPFLLLTSIVAAPVAWARRSVTLGLACLVLLVPAWQWLSSDTGFGSQRDVPAAPALRVASANLAAADAEAAQAFAQLAGVSAGVILVQELDQAGLDAILATAAVADYPFQILDPREGFYGSAIFSRWPLEGDVLWVAGWPMTHGTVTVGDADIRVINVHLIAPTTNGSIELWKDQYSELSAIAEAESAPLLVMGDFNATMQHRPLQVLVDTGLTDIFLDTGKGHGATWPVGGRLPWPILRLDRALANSGLLPLAHHHGEAIGSDHRPIWVDVAVNEPADDVGSAATQ